MSISVIGASSKSKQVRIMKSTSDLQSYSFDEKCKECGAKDDEVSIQIVGEPLIEKQKEMSLAHLHKKVEQELKEKQKKIDFLRKGIMRSPSTTRSHTCKESNHEVQTKEATSTTCCGWCRSHPILMCILCMLVISIVIFLIIIIVVIRK